MKNAVKTEIVTIRLPCRLIDVIDIIIEDGKEYANRPDFVISAIRFYFKEYIVYTIPEETVKDKVIQKRIEEKKNKIADSLKKSKRRYRECFGEPKRIAIRIPVGFTEKWNRVQANNGPITNFQDFIRFAIMRYMEDEYNAFLCLTKSEEGL
jgi:Arc/MetJ-type ribon-helix-helix transcriptional regulator